MGLDYRFHLVFPVASADAALQALAQQLSPDDHRRLAAALPWQAANARVTSWRSAAIWERSGVLTLARREHDRKDAFHFQLRVQIDHALQRYERERDVRLPRDEQAALLACWTSVASGARLFVISAMLVNQELRRLCETSASLLALWQRVAGLGRAHALFLDTDPQSPRKLLYPALRDVPRPECAQYELSDHIVATDGYWAESLSLAGISLPPLSCPPREPADRMHHER